MLGILFHGRTYVSKLWNEEESRLGFKLSA